MAETSFDKLENYKRAVTNFFSNPSIDEDITQCLIEINTFLTKGKYVLTVDTYYLLEYKSIEVKKGIGTYLTGEVGLFYNKGQLHRALQAIIKSLLILKQQEK